MACYIHQSRGRLRVRSAVTKDNPEMLSNAAGSLQSIRGVRAVNISPITGSLVVRYDDTLVLPATLINHLAKQKILKGVVGFPKPLPHSLCYPRVITGGQNAAAPRISPEAQKILLRVGKVFLALVLERVVDKKTRAILSVLL